jgi:hypothetical protein
MIFDKAGCDRRKGSPLRSDERAEERAPLTAVASGQIMQLSGAKKTKENLSGTKQPGTAVYTNPEHYHEAEQEPFRFVPISILKCGFNPERPPRRP